MTRHRTRRDREACAQFCLSNSVTAHWGGCGLRTGSTYSRRKWSRTPDVSVWRGATRYSAASRDVLTHCFFFAALRLRVHHGRRTSAHHLVPPTMRAARHARAIRSSRVPVPRRRRTFNHGRTAVEAVRTLVMPSRPCNVFLLRPPHPSSPTSHRPF